MFISEETLCKLRLRILVGGENIYYVAKEYDMHVSEFEKMLFKCSDKVRKPRSVKKVNKIETPTKDRHIFRIERTKNLLQEAEAGASVKSLAKKYGITEQTVINHIKARG